MTRPRPTSFERELERRLDILARGEEVDRRLPIADTVLLVAITVASSAIVLIVQAL